MNLCGYSVRARWGGRVESPLVIGDKFAQTLDRLSAGHPIFHNWGVADIPSGHDWEAIERDTEILSLADARDQMTDLVEGHVYYDDDIEAPDPRGGYQPIAFNDFDKSTDVGPTDLTLSLTAGSEFAFANQVELDAGNYQTKPDPTIVTYDIFRLALNVLVETWRPDWASAPIHGWNNAAGSLPPAYEALWDKPLLVPWMAYLSTPFAAGLQPPAEIHAERLEDGGLIMVATKDRLDPTNAEHMRRAKLIIDILEARLPPSLYKVTF
jgi:hypothetical protein